MDVSFPVFWVVAAVSFVAWDDGSGLVEVSFPVFWVVGAVPFVAWDVGSGLVEVSFPVFWVFTVEVSTDGESEA